MMLVLAAVLVVVALALAAQAGRAANIQVSSVGGEERHGSCPHDSRYRTAHKLRRPLPFCTEYEDRACCDDETAREIRETVHDLVRPECDLCFNMVREWKCSECHPQAGDFYVGARASILFCQDYCEKVFAVCSDIPLDLQAGPFYLNDPMDMTAEEWCQGRTGAEGQCFRGTLNPTPEQIENATECKCLDQDCHDEAVDALNKAIDDAEREGRSLYPWMDEDPDADHDEL